MCFFNTIFLITYVKIYSQFPLEYNSKIPSSVTLKKTRNSHFQIQRPFINLGTFASTNKRSKGQLPRGCLRGMLKLRVDRRLNRPIIVRVLRDMISKWKWVHAYIQCSLQHPVLGVHLWVKMIIRLTFVYLLLFADVRPPTHAFWLHGSRRLLDLLGRFADRTLWLCASAAWH